MKQIPLTPDLEATIRQAVGPDVSLDGIAIFEAIALNTLPLTGKRGTLFESAQVSYLTLKQMADNINGGNHLPLMFDHNMEGAPFGRVFSAALNLNDQGNAELRTLFYVDPTETQLISKLNSGTADEVSVNFLASQIMCSECEFDYRGDDATFANLMDRTCPDGHVVGTDGVHVRLIGLAEFVELSVVSRGAANNAKIVGKSQSKLATPLQQLAAKGFEVDKFYLTASRGELEVDLEKIVTQLTEKSAELGALNLKLTASDEKVANLTAQLTDAQARVTDLERQLGDTTLKDERDAALAFLNDIYGKLATAAGETDVKPLATTAELKAGIEKYNDKLTAILPIGGVSNKNREESGAQFKSNAASAFKVSKS